MQKKEKIETKKLDIRASKFRKGASGNFNDDLSKDDIIKLNKIIKFKLNDNFKKLLNLTNI